MTNLDTTRTRELIEKRGFTFKHVARCCFIKYGSFFHILGGRANASERVIFLLAQTLNTNVDYLTGKSDDPTPLEAA
jgi:transcriptional regulator with XRE-family HTH domain